jgi:prepilin-type N-terminal cleavage/methylation domain-containing protein
MHNSWTQNMNRNSHGFTLLELMVVVSIIAIIAGMAVAGYQYYTEKAAGTELIEQYDALRGQVVADAQSLGIDPCVDPPQSLIPKQALYNEHAELAIFKVDLGNSKPLVLQINASVAAEGKHNVAIARAAHDVLNRSNVIVPGAVVNDSAVSFLALLTNTPCTGMQLAAGGPGQTGPGQAVQPVQPKIMAELMKFSGSDVYVRPAGDGRLDTDGDLEALTLDMSFIGDGSIPAASGGQGPVMFNYGDASNGHNAFSLWNPRSLTVAIGGKNYDTGLDVVDGQTHRVTTSWDGSTGTLDVYDNGQRVKSFSGVAQGQKLAGNGFMTVAHKGEPGQYSPGEAFNGQVFHASLANVAASAQQAANPLHQSLDKDSGLLTDMRVEGSQIVDRTGRQQLVTGSGVSAAESGVEARLVN